MSDLPNVRLELSNGPENVLVVREMLTGVAEAIGLRADELNDVRTAVTEACNNVVLHAYEGGEGQMHVKLYAQEEALEVVVCDEGVGIQPRIRDPDDEALGIGLHVIQALAHRVEFTDVEGGGTEVRMEFAARPAEALEPLDGEEPACADIAPPERATTVGIAIGPAALARTVLPRLLCTLAAQAHFSTDRISDAQLVADALAAHAPGSLDGHHLSVTVKVRPRRLGVRVGPLGAGRAGRLVLESDVDGLGPIIEKLADEHRVAVHGSSEVLDLQLVDRR